MSGGAVTLKVCLVRHAQPAVPPGKRFLGQADPPLGPAGLEQARRLADRLAEHLGDRAGGHPGGTSAEHPADAGAADSAAAAESAESAGSPSAARFDVAYSSDLRRCLQTAEILVGSTGTPLIPLPRLREIDTGLWQNLTFAEAARLHPAEYAARERDVIGYRFPGGESFRDLQARVVPVFLELVNESFAAGRENLLVVGHKGPNRVLLCHLLGLPLEVLFSIEQDYCALTILEIPAEQAGEEHPPGGRRTGAGPFGAEPGWQESS